MPGSAREQLAERLREWAVDLEDEALPPYNSIDLLRKAAAALAAGVGVPPPEDLVSAPPEEQPDAREVEGTVPAQWLLDEKTRRQDAEADWKEAEREVRRLREQLDAARQDFKRQLRLGTEDVRRERDELVLQNEACGNALVDLMAAAQRVADEREGHELGGESPLYVALVALDETLARAALGVGDSRPNQDSGSAPSKSEGRAPDGGAEA